MISARGQEGGWQAGTLKGFLDKGKVHLDYNVGKILKRGEAWIRPVEVSFGIKLRLKKN